MCKYIPICSANGSLEAEMIRIFLEAAGINALVLQESAGLTLGLTVGPLGEAQILVSPNQFDEAKEMLESIEEYKLDDLENILNEPKENIDHNINT